MKGILLSLLFSLGLTLLLESVFYTFIHEKSRRDYLLLVLVNIVTNPVVVLLQQLLRAGGAELFLATAALEGAAVLVEWLFYRRYAEKINRPLLFSLGANVFSYGTGKFLQYTVVRILRYIW